MALIQLAYSSRAMGDPDQIDLDEILEKCREKNARLGITGILIYKDGYFFQVLEGGEEEVDSLYDTIVKDSRHEMCICILRQETEKRAFAGWSMGYVSLDNIPEGSMPRFFNLESLKNSFVELAGNSEVVSKMINGFARDEELRKYVI